MQKADLLGKETEVTKKRAGTRECPEMEIQPAGFTQMDR